MTLGWLTKGVKSTDVIDSQVTVREKGQSEPSTRSSSVQICP